MFTFNFEDYKKPKYSEIGEFHEGLACVRDRETSLCGYIDKTGQEVIPCLYLDAGDFSDNLAPVETASGYGYIDREGIMAIYPSFKTARAFTNGLAVVQLVDGYWGYIDRNGTNVLEQIPREGLPFQENKALFSLDEEESYCYDGKSTRSIKGQWITPFSEGVAVLKRHGLYCIVDSDLKVVHREDASVMKEIGPCKDGLIRLVSNAGRVAYLNLNFEPQIPFMYKSGRDFREGKAFIQLSNDVIGFVDIEGRATAFMKNIQYTEIGDYHDGRALVKSSKGCGYLDTDSKECIPCKFNAASSFSEHLAGVFDGENFSYIDAAGAVSIALPYTYYSELTFNGKKHILKAESEAGLYRCKERTLKKIRETIIRELDRGIAATLDEEAKKLN